ncbi:MAG: lamin tail domain-containing protein [Caldilineaceae bacterium]|nr:lamin tail domain-containing protein [Caldilineaceae bacterium]
MQERRGTRSQWPKLRWSRRQRSLWIFWGGIVLVLLLGLERILADPDQANNAPVGSVVISEFGAAGSGPTDEYGETPDWIELHNRTPSAVSLTDWVLTDDPTQPDKWRFDKVTIEPGAYLVVFASGRDQNELDEDELFLHTSFRLNSDGGYLALYPPTARQFLDGTVYEYPAQLPQYSYALVQDERGQWSPRYLAHPTPGAANDTSVTWASILPPVAASLAHGFYDAPIDVALSAAVADARIQYTTDGTTPSAEHGTPYTEPIPIRQTTVLRAVALLPDYAPSPVTTQSYIFLEDVRNQPAAPPGWPQTWGIHSLSRGPYVEGTPVEADYAMDARVVNDPITGPCLEDGLLAIPTISLVTDQANLDIFATPQARGRETERTVSVEWIDPSSEGDGFQINAGLRIQGNAGRLEYMPKHSFRLFFRQLYGAAKLIYPLFADSHLMEFETLVLRGGVNRSFAGDFVDEAANLDLREKTTYLRDEWVRASQIAMSGAGAHGRFVHLYINGLYWGLYNLVERPDASFAASYLGGDEDAWSSANHGGAVSGPPDRFAALLDQARAGGMEDPARYATLLEFLDPAQFSDYVIVNWYAGNVDWPETNWYASVHNPAGRNYFWVWDAEATWDEGAKIRLGDETAAGAPYPNVVKLLFEAAWANSDFRMTFADRLYHHLKEKGALTDTASVARWRTLQASIERAIVAESARWGDVRYAEPITLADWQAANEDVLRQMEGNGAKLIELARAAGYYPPLDPPTLSPAGGEFSGEQTVTLAAPTGAIYYTTDGSDPRAAVTGEPAPNAQRYSAPVPITTTSVLRARLLVDGVWSALQEANFAESSEAPHLVISEIMYRPYLNEAMEFLELHNVGNTAADLSGAYFEGIDFRFAAGVRLNPGQHLVLIRDFRAFRERYPDAEIAGQYGGKLSDKGETISLYHPQGELWLEVTYDDNYGWPLSANGAGDSLVLMDPLGDLSSPHNWRASQTLYGTPGADEPGGE